MPRLMKAAAVVPAAGNRSKVIAEYVAVCLPAFSREMAHREV
jgi:hypothetical protein